MGRYEMRQYLAEAKHWGFNRYGDWFDMLDCSDPFKKRLYQDYMLSTDMWKQKKQNFLSAQALGLRCDLIITPNHVYVDQCRPELMAEVRQDPLSTKGFGQCICPSKPAARAIILKNYENLFTDLAAVGVRLDSITCAPYDFGGCACKECQPYILTFVKLMREIHALAKHHHPGVENHMFGWQWSDEEHRLVTDWADREAPGWIKSVYVHIYYGATNIRSVQLPKGCQRRAFVHIGYADLAAPRDAYGVFGPVVAATRLQQTVKDLAGSGVTGVMAYSEGVCDDVNKALFAGLASGQFRTADEVLRAYAQRYFAADQQQAAQWAQWLAAWGRPFDVDPQQSAQQLAALKQASGGGWRQRQWELKLESVPAQQGHQRGETVDACPAGKPSISFGRSRNRFIAACGGWLFRRQAFTSCCPPMSWYDDWAKHVAAERPSVESLGDER